MTDITTRDDIKTMVDAFYEKVKANPVLQPKFAHVDCPHHLPIMYDFWSSMLLGDRSYAGNPFQKHIPLGLNAQHFGQWLQLFHETVREHFEGPVATEVLSRADSIAGLFQHRLGIAPKN